MKNKTILTVDDSTTNLDILVDLLSDYNVLDVTNGEDALEIINEEPIDLILLDIMMPDMDGLEVCQRIKNNPHSKDIPIIFITALNDEKNIEKAYMLGGIDYITKPFKPRELLAKVKVQFRLQELQNYVLEINQNLEAKVKTEVEKNKEQQFMLLQQNRLAKMGEMINMIAHQWREPLNSINMKIQGLQFDYDDGLLKDKDYVRSFIDKNKSTIFFMSQTIDDFRNFLTKNKNKQLFNVLEATQKVQSMQSAELAFYDIEIEVEGHGFEFLGFESEYQQVILNLISNAKDALISGKILNPKITIIFKGKQIIIQDNGGGIPEKIINKVFEAYFTTKENIKGMGIGLYMSKTIIEGNMGGKLTVENHNDGARFIIDLDDEI